MIHISVRTISLAVFCAASTCNAGAESANALEQDMVLIPAGDFIMGSNKLDDTLKSKEFGSVKPWFMDEHPQHKQHLNAFYMDRYEVTNARYRAYIADGHQPPEYWLETGYIVSIKPEKLKELDVEKLRRLAVERFDIDADTRTMDKPQLLSAIQQHFQEMDVLPVVYASWFDANAFCRWAGKRLPSEAEWELAARGRDGNEFTWGNDWAAGKSNTGDQEWPMGVAPVGSYQDDKSPFGIFDLAGNVSEWTADWYQPYPGSDFSSADFGHKFRVVRGAAWGGSGHYALQLYLRGAYRFNLPANYAKEDLGFRCAKDEKSTKSNKKAKAPL
ncbi:MAG: formylglycine-generating enzyme family protein [Gammaproteobacteria bacterium]|nr:formylglycine-generating enzyme family protein [Gammaproteobacteria bacterium]